MFCQLKKEVENKPYLHKHHLRLGIRIGGEEKLAGEENKPCLQADQMLHKVQNPG